MDNENLNNNKEAKTLLSETTLPRYENKPSGLLIVKDEFKKQDLRRLRFIIYPGILLIAAAIDLSLRYTFTLETYAYEESIQQGMESMEQSLFAKSSCILNSQSYKDDPLLRVMDKNKPLLTKAYFDDQMVLVSRSYTYAARDIYTRKLAKQDLESMIRDARQAGHFLEVNSGYRSFELQSDWFEQTKINGIDNITATPGSSEHQLGTAFDISSHRGEVATVAGYNWLLSNAYKYGFVLSYPKDREEETGLEYEPWHWRYVGKDVAIFFHETEHLINLGDSLFLESVGDVYPHNFFGDYLGIYLFKNKNESKVILDKGINDVYPVGFLYKTVEPLLQDGAGESMQSKISIRGVEAKVYAKYVKKLDSHLIFVYEDVEGVKYSFEQIEKTISRFCPAL